jgi:hypothetical protein
MSFGQTTAKAVREIKQLELNNTLDQLVLKDGEA